MVELQIHADRTQPALVHGALEPWVASPQVGVQRLFLERVGGEVALASSIVRYLPGSRFPVHSHALGEEFFVLEGTFSDEHGHYPNGTYVRNPPGTQHAPFSESGCVIFVKLRQMHPAETQSVRVLAADLRWSTSSVQGHSRAPLFSADGVTVHLERLAAGATVPAERIDGGEEIFVVQGRLQLLGEGQSVLNPWSWLRSPGHSTTGLVSVQDALFWRKQGHLTPGPGIRDG